MGAWGGCGEGRQDSESDVHTKPEGGQGVSYVTSAYGALQAEETTQEITVTGTH